jgi:iron complex outermembrane receptor protein
MEKRLAVRWPSFGMGCLLFISTSFHLQAQTNATEATPQQLKKLSLEDLMKLDVTSVSKQPEPFAQAPAAIDVVTAEDIQRSGASSIPEALRLADNLQVAQINSHDWAISARGFDTSVANKLLVLMDGRTLYTPLYAGVFWDVQDYLLEDIDRIEVISGPGGTLWGANAVNGVINITSKSAKDTQGLYLEAGGGNQLQDFTGVRYGETVASNVYLRVYGKYFDRGAEVFSDGAGAGDRWTFGQTGFRMDWYSTPQNIWTVQGDFYDGAEGTLTTNDTRVGGGNVLTRFTHSFSEESDLSVQLYFDDTHRLVPFAYAENLNTYDLDIQDRFHWGDYNHFVVGGGYRFTDDDVANSPELAFLPPHLDRNLFNVFGQDEITIAQGLNLTLGTKVEHNDWTGFEVEPSGRLGWTMAPGQFVWGAISRAVRTPSEIDEDFYVPGNPPYYLAGSSNFVSESLLAYELGYRAQLTPTVSASLSTYYNEYDHLRSISPPTAPGGPEFLQNNLEGQTYGFEAGSTWQVLDWWRLHGGYNLLKEHLYARPGTVDRDNATGETSDPQQQFSIRSSMDLPHNIEFDVDPRYVDKLYDYSGGVTGTVPAYFELNVRLAWRITSGVEVSVVGQNLLHDHHPEFGFPSAERQEIERSVYGKVAWNF